MNLKEFVWTV